jgi:hypothetical protein
MHKFCRVSNIIEEPKVTLCFSVTVEPYTEKNDFMTSITRPDGVKAVFHYSEEVVLYKDPEIEEEGRGRGLLHEAEKEPKVETQRANKRVREDDNL